MFLGDHKLIPRKRFQESILHHESSFYDATWPPQRGLNVTFSLAVTSCNNKLPIGMGKLQIDLPFLVHWLNLYGSLDERRQGNNNVTACAGNDSGVAGNTR